MSAHENKAVVTRVIEEVLNRGKDALVDELFARSYANTPLWSEPRRPNSMPTLEGPEGLKE